MRGRGSGSNSSSSNGVPTDLMVCFPTRAHLSLMPKPICSPSRATEPKNLHHRRRHRPVRGGSPLFKAKPKNNAENDEPTSPKVTCAGQIKVRPRPRSGPAHWASVVVEMEKLRKCKKFGLKRDAMQLLGFLRGIRFNLSCFGNFPAGVHCTTDDDEDVDDDDEDEEDDEEEASRTIFSKWFEVLEENQVLNESKKEKMTLNKEEVYHESDSAQPPPNALLLMRCRSAPEKRWPAAEEEAAPMPAVDCRRQNIKDDFFESTDVARETWILGSMDPLARSRSWRR